MLTTISNLTSMAAKKKPAPYSRPRKSREQGAIALLDAAVELLTEKSPDQVTTAEIAERAGLNRAHIVRYFGNRGELLASAVEHFYATNVASNPAPEIQTILSESGLLQNTIRWYMKVVSYLLTIGVPPERFHTVQQAIFDRVASFMGLPNASPRLRSTLVNMAVLLMQATEFFGDLDELSDDDKYDILILMSTMGGAAKALDTSTGWKNEADS
ncbi:MAG: Bacterial regulatory protein tetR family [Actinomycetota bacterium]|jgi:AcrR family transcriptional regulator